MFHFILVFIGVATFFALLDMEFMCLMVLLIYVGNIACMFLFVVMMLNVKILELKLSQFMYVPMGIIICFTFYITLLYYTQRAFYRIPGKKSCNRDLAINELQTTNYNFNMPILKEIDSYTTSLQALGDLIFTQYLAAFIISGLILLVSLIVAILLTLSSPSKINKRKIYMNPWIGEKIEHSTLLLPNKAKTLKTLSAYYYKKK
jgi:NADH-quinone oxidoreductase subunit J